MKKINKTLIISFLLLMYSTSISLSQSQIMRPIFIEYTESVKCPKGGIAIFNYDIIGIPNPSVEIRYDFGALINRDIFINNNGLMRPKYESLYYNNHLQFAINDVDERDVRKYLIIGYNRAGDAFIESSLTIDNNLY